MAQNLIKRESAGEHASNVAKPFFLLCTVFQVRARLIQPAENLIDKNGCDEGENGKPDTHHRRKPRNASHACALLGAPRRNCLVQVGRCLMCVFENVLVPEQ